MEIKRASDGEVTSVKVQGYIDEVIQAKAHFLREQGKRPFAVVLNAHWYEQLWYRVREFLITRRDSGLTMYIGLLVIVADVDGFEVVESPHDQALRRLGDDASILRESKT